MKAYVIEKKSTGEAGWVPVACQSDGDEARRLADLWSKAGDAYRAVGYSETLKSRVVNGLWLVREQSGRFMWAGDEEGARKLASEIPHARAAAFEPSLT